MLRAFGQAQNRLQVDNLRRSVRNGRKLLRQAFQINPVLKIIIHIPSLSAAWRLPRFHRQQLLSVLFSLDHAAHIVHTCRLTCQEPCRGNCACRKQLSGICHMGKGDDLSLIHISPVCGKDKMATFERYFIADKETHKETKNAYYRLYDNEEILNKILREFGLDEHRSHIINGHVRCV